MKIEYNNLYTHFIFSEHHRKISFQEEYDTFIKFYQKTLIPFQKNVKE